MTTLTVGRFTCAFVSDGRVGPIPAASVVADAAVAAGMSDYETPMNIAVLRAGDDVTLVDAGMGGGATTGRLVQELEQLSVAPADVDRVLVTHLHADHVLGLLTEGALTFPNARVHVPPADVAWVRETGRNTMPLLEALVHAGLLADLSGLPAEIEPIDTPGHTPGHTSFRVTGPEGVLLIGGDAVLLDAHFADPSIAVTFDDDGTRAEASRRAFLDLAASIGAAVSLYHIEQPLGRVSADGSAYNWQPA